MKKCQLTQTRTCNRGASATGNAELELRNIQSFGCHKKGHVISACPEKRNKESSRVIQTDCAAPAISTGAMATDPWIRVLTVTKGDDPVDDNAVRLVYIQAGYRSCRCKNPSTSG